MGKERQENSQAEARELEALTSKQVGAEALPRKLEPSQSRIISESSPSAPNEAKAVQTELKPNTSVTETSPTESDGTAKKEPPVELKCFKGQGKYGKLFTLAKHGYIQKTQKLHEEQFASEMPRAVYSAELFPEESSVDESLKVTPLLVLFKTLDRMHSENSENSHPQRMKDDMLKQFKAYIDFYQKHTVEKKDVHPLTPVLEYCEQINLDWGQDDARFHDLMEYLKNACATVTASPATASKEKPSENNSSKLIRRLLVWLQPHKTPVSPVPTTKIESATSTKMGANTIAPSSSDSARSSTGSNSQATEPSPNSSFSAKTLTQ